MAQDVGLGVATTFGQERDMPTSVACVARVRVDRTSGRAIVEKLTLVVAPIDHLHVNQLH
jgi:hypothetical protein